MSEGTVGTVERVIKLMAALAEAGGDANIKMLTERVDLPASTVHRLLALLMKVGIVDRGDMPRSYRVGVEFYRLGALVVSSISAREIARPYLERVAAESGEVSLLMRYMRGQNCVMLEDSVDGPNPLRYSTSLYAPLSVLWGATGRSVLAFLPEKEIEEVLAAGEPSPVGNVPPPTREMLRDELAEIRSKGYALTFGQKIPGSVGFGAPIFDRAGQVFGSLCVTIPQIRFEPAQEEKVPALLRREAAGLSAALGYRGDVYADLRARG